MVAACNARFSREREGNGAHYRYQHQHAQVTSRGETSRTTNTAHPAQAERSGCAWIEAYLERLEGKELRETFYERLECASFRSS
jgi:hypothetical protein